MHAIDPRVLRSALTRADRRRRRQGMNLVEVMIVVAIIVVLVTVLSVAAFQVYRQFGVSQTKLQMNQIGQMAMSQMMLGGKKVPSNLRDIEGVTDSIAIDAWGRELIWEVPGPGNEPFDIVSLGADGVEGGTGLDEDIRYSASK
jgi:general secretion pathway protein G